MKIIEILQRNSWNLNEKKDFMNFSHKKKLKKRAF